MLSCAERRLVELLNHLYGAIQNPELWKEFLDLLNRHTHSAASTLFLQNLRPGQPVSRLAHGAAVSFQHYVSSNPYLPPDGYQRSEANVRAGELFLSLSQQLEQSRSNLVHTIDAYRAIEQSHLVYLTLNRAERHGAYGAETTDLLGTLIPHLERVFALSDLVHTREQLSHSFDSPHAAVFVVTTEGRILEMSRRAQALVMAKDGMTVERQAFLRPLHREDQAAFTALLERLAGAAVQTPSAFRVKRPGNPADHIVIIQPLAKSSGPIRALATFAVVIPQEDSLAASVRLVAGPAFALTKAEVRLAVALIETGSLDGAMQTLGITRNTAKTQMSSIFRKTSTRRQGELMRFLTTIANFTNVSDERMSASQ